MYTSCPGVGSMVMLNSRRGNVDDGGDALAGVTTGALPPLLLRPPIDDGSYDSHEYRRSYGNRRE
jgi:hypothetical protein